MNSPLRTYSWRHCVKFIRHSSGLVVLALGWEFEVQSTDGGRVLACLSVSLAVPLTFSQLVSVSPTVRLFLDLTCSWEYVSHRVLHHRRRCPLEVCLSHFYSSCQPDSIAGCVCVRLPCWHMLLKSPLLLPLSICLTLLLLPVWWRNLSTSTQRSFCQLGDKTMQNIAKECQSPLTDISWISCYL